MRSFGPWLACCFAAGLPALAADQWIKLTSPPFTMYTSNGKGTAVEALRTFEEARDFFAANSPSKSAPDVPVEIIAFKSEKQYEPYRANKGAFAYYQRGHKCDYIVMQQLGHDHLPAAIHEYTHLLVEHLGLHLPLWLNEGLAEVYSSLQSKGDKLMVGTPPPNRVDVLRVRGPLDVRVLLTVGRDSPYYTKPEPMAQFYATAWELAHMLLLGKEYREGFHQFLAQVSAGKPPEEVVAEVYHKNLDNVNIDLRTYLSSGSITVSLFDIHLDEKQLQPEIADASPLAVDLVLADLQSTHPETMEQARARLTQLESELPNSGDVEESLAYLAAQQGNSSEAKRHFESALKKGAKSPDLLFNYAAVLHARQAPSPEIIDVLQQAIQLKPDFYNARFNLGMEAAQQGDCKLAISALTGIKTVRAEHALPVFSTEAYCYWRLDNPNEARRLAEMAKQYAKTPDETKRVQNLLDQLNRVNPPQ
jgi:tetratricopeptide (TPR) repeat protein